MKILIINTVRFRLNGITSVIMNYFRKMDKSGMQTDFVVINEISDEYRAELEQAGANIFYLPRKKNPMGYITGLYRIMKREKYDIVHIHGNSATTAIELMIAKWTKTPVRIAHSHNTTCSHQKVHNLLYPVFRNTYTQGFACGEEAGRWMFREDPFFVLKNGIDLPLFTYDETIREEYRTKLGLTKEHLLLGHVGNFIEQKNHSFLLEVFETLYKKDDRYCLLLISDGYLFEEMQEKARRLGISQAVIFFGKTTEVSKYYQAMDLFLLPSLHEGLPVVLVEAQACGLLCLVSDKVSEESNLCEEMKFLPIDDRNLWAEAVEEVRKDSRDRQNRCSRWQQKITQKGYNISNNANCMKELYREYLDKSR